MTSNIPEDDWLERTIDVCPLCSDGRSSECSFRETQEIFEKHAPEAGEAKGVDHWSPTGFTTQRAPETADGLLWDDEPLQKYVSHPLLVKATLCAYSDRSSTCSPWD